MCIYSSFHKSAMTTSGQQVHQFIWNSRVTGLSCSGLFVVSSEADVSLQPQNNSLLRPLCFNLLLRCAASSLLLPVTPLPISAAGLLFSNNPAAFVRNTLVAHCKLQLHILVEVGAQNTITDQKNDVRLLTESYAGTGLLNLEGFSQIMGLLPTISFERLSRICRGRTAASMRVKSE